MVNRNFLPYVGLNPQYLERQTMALPLPFPIKILKKIKMCILEIKITYELRELLTVCLATDCFFPH